MSRTSLLIADDHDLFRQGICRLVRSYCVVVAETGDGANVLDLVATHTPHVVLLDLGLPNVHGLHLIEPIRRLQPLTGIVIVTQYAAPVVAERSIRLGANAFLPKFADGSELQHAIHAASEGRQYVSTRIADHHDPAVAAMAVTKDRLTDREQLVVDLIARGMTNGEMASMIGTTARTIHFHRTNIRRKLRLHSDAALLRFAILVDVTSCEDRGSREREREREREGEREGERE
jgi:DNA-binding NarL/FixJ family response regulator